MHVGRGVWDSAWEKRDRGLLHCRLNGQWRHALAGPSRVNYPIRHLSSGASQQTSILPGCRRWSSILLSLTLSHSLSFSQYRSTFSRVIIFSLISHLSRAKVNSLSTTWKTDRNCEKYDSRAMASATLLLGPLVVPFSATDPQKKRLPTFNSRVSLLTLSPPLALAHLALVWRKAVWEPMRRRQSVCERERRGKRRSTDT